MKIKRMCAGYYLVMLDTGQQWELSRSAENRSYSEEGYLWVASCDEMGEAEIFSSRKRDLIQELRRKEITK